MSKSVSDPTEEDLRLARELDERWNYPLTRGQIVELAAFRAGGRSEMLRWVLASLKEFPNGGGDIEVMQEVERLRAEARRERDAEWTVVMGTTLNHKGEGVTPEWMREAYAQHHRHTVQSEREACERIVDEGFSLPPREPRATVHAYIKRRLRERA